jgi:thiol-disulfide isomerase/thioredoxin
MRLSSLKGQVVVVEFLLTNCPHCQRVAQMISRLHRELGPRGLRPIGIAFDVNITEPMVTDFARRLGAAYPIGYCPAAAVDSFLGRGVTERFMVPQIVVIDRMGVIRAQSRPQGEKDLEDESYLRTLLDDLLR